LASNTIFKLISFLHIFFEKPDGDLIGIRLLVREFEIIMWIADSEAGIKSGEIRRCCRRRPKTGEH